VEWVSGFSDEDTIRMVNVEFRLGLPAVDRTNHDRVTEALRRMADSNLYFHLELVEYLLPDVAEGDQRGGTAGDCRRTARASMTSYSSRAPRQRGKPNAVGNSECARKLEVMARP
jgi:hypothetical protein